MFLGVHSCASGRLAAWPESCARLPGSCARKSRAALTFNIVDGRTGAYVVALSPYRLAACPAETDWFDDSGPVS